MALVLQSMRRADCQGVDSSRASQLSRDGHAAEHPPAVTTRPTNTAACPSGTTAAPVCSTEEGSPTPHCLADRPAGSPMVVPFVAPARSSWCSFCRTDTVCSHRHHTRRTGETMPIPTTHPGVRNSRFYGPMPLSIRRPTSCRPTSCRTKTFPWTAPSGTAPTRRRMRAWFLIIEPAEAAASPCPPLRHGRSRPNCTSRPSSSSRGSPGPPQKRSSSRTSGLTC